MRNVSKLIEQEFSGRQAWRYAERIAQYSRIQASPGFRKAAIQIVSLLGREGIEAAIHDFPAQEGIRFSGRQSFREWRCRSGELWLREKDGGKRRLARYQEEEVSLVQRSGPTPPRGVEGLLVHVPDGENPESYRDLDLRGKIALVRGNPMTIFSLAAEEHGAIGLVFDNLNDYPPLRTRADLPDAIQYTSFWWSGQEQAVFGFCVSPRVGDELRQLLKQGEVTLFARVDADFYDGTFENVEYFIPGKKEQEILLVAHLCHPYPGAQDNAAGPAVLMEVIRTLQRLFDQGDLAQPELGIRFLMVPEMTGTFAYLDRYPERIGKTVAAFNLDMVGADQSKGGGPLTIEQPPMGTPTFLDRYAFGILDSFSRDIANFSGTNRYSSCHYLQTRFSGGSDHYVLSDPSIGIPCPMAIQWPDRHYHTSLDRADNLDPAMLKRVGMMTALYALGLAQGSEKHWLDFLVADVASRGEHLRTVMEWAFTKETLRENWSGVLDFYLDYEARALEQLRRYAQIRDFSELAAKIDWAQACLATTGVHLRNWAGQKAELVRADSVQAEKIDPAAAGRVYQRVYPGPLDLGAELTRLPLSRRKSWNSYARSSKVGSGYTTFLLYWLDGFRPLHEVLELVKLESGAWHPQFALEYLELCAELGLVRLLT